VTDQPFIDLRSDTVTRPTAAMREVMAGAEVGDDQFGEDPTVNRLQERIADLLGHEAALWFPTGTMANQVAIRTLTRPGDEVLVPHQAHVLWHETGGAAATSGVQLTEIGPETRHYGVGDLEANRKPRGHAMFPPTTVAVVENTHNRLGGLVLSVDAGTAIAHAARAADVASFLDGARLWNAAIALGVAPATLATPFDLVSIAFSKGLGAPGGSMLAGSRPIIDGAVRYRRMAGGAMRQVGIFAAAAEHALDHHLDRLVEDHANARLLAERLATAPGVELDLATVESNIVVARLVADAPDAATVAARARDAGVLVSILGPRTIRAVTHLDVTREQVVAAADVLVAAVGSAIPA
jgi:threonine aldolase